MNFMDMSVIDDAVIDHLKTQVSLFNQHVDSLDTVEQLLEKGKPTPRAHTLLGGFRLGNELGNSGYQQGELELAVYVVTDNVSGKGAARKKENVGAYALSKETYAALKGYQPTPCIKLIPKSGRLWYATQYAAIYELKFTADISEDC